MAKEKVIWITGVSTGIGRAIAETFLRNGNKVVGSARSEDKLQEISEKYYDNFIPAAMDISDFENVKKAYELIKREYQVETLINNAGITSFKSAVDNTVEEIDEIIKVNLLGGIYTIKTVLDDMITAGEGNIFNISSVAAKRILTNSTAYAASKLGLAYYSQVLREELRENNIRVVNFYPGATVTPIWPDKVVDKNKDRMMKPEDIARFVYDVYRIDSNLVTEEIVMRPKTGDL
jgi:3-oxoacyl-[acyl-carrier protein] reductase